MVITLVIDQYVGNDGKVSNGTTMTALRFAEKLKEHGHTVKIITCTENDDENIFVVPKVKIPVFQKLIESQGFCWAKADREILRKSFEGSDVIHFLMPFRLQKKGKDIADEMGIASTAAFHVQPENITYTVGIGKVGFINKLIYKGFRDNFFNKFGHIHCPSEMIKRQLVKNKYKSKLHVISNGVDEVFKKVKVEKPEEYKDKHVLLMIGRYSREKRQDLIIKAVANSKYKDKIVVVLAGKGPRKAGLEKLAKKHGVEVKYVFLQRPELIKLINYADLYVHASDIEIEAIACMEAFSCGLPPIISDSKLSATSQFALSEHNLFKKANYKDLTKKLEFMIEHPEIKKELSKKYLEYSKQFRLDNCVRELEKVFETAVEENKVALEKAKEVKTKAVKK